MTIETFPTSSNYEIYSKAKLTPITQEDLKQSFQINKEASSFGEFVTSDVFNSAVNQAEGSWTPRNMSYQVLAEAAQIGSSSSIADITNNQSTANQADTTCQTVETLAQTTVDPKAIATDEVKSACNNASKKAATTAYTLSSDFANGALNLIALTGLGFKGNSVKLHSDTITSLRSPHITQTAQDFSITGNNSVQIGSNLTNLKSKSFINVTDTHVTQSKNSAKVTTGTETRTAANSNNFTTGKHQIIANEVVAAGSDVGIVANNTAQFHGKSGVLVNSQGNIEITTGQALSDLAPAAEGEIVDTVESILNTAQVVIKAFDQLTNTFSSQVVSDQGIGQNTLKNIVSFAGGSNYSSATGTNALVGTNAMMGTPNQSFMINGMGTQLGFIPYVPVVEPVFGIDGITEPAPFPTFPKIPTAQLEACLPKDKKKKPSDKAPGTSSDTNLPPYDASQANIPDTSGPITVQGTKSQESKLPQFDPSKATTDLDPAKNVYTGEFVDLPEFNKTNAATSLITSDGVVKLPFTVDGATANAPTADLGIAPLSKLGNGFVNPGIYLNKPDFNSEESIANGNFLIDTWEEEFYQDDLDELTSDYLRLGIEDIDLPGVTYEVMSEFLPDFESYFNAKLQENLSPSEVKADLRTGSTELQVFLDSYPDSLPDLVRAYEEFQAKQAIGGLSFLSIFDGLGSLSKSLAGGDLFSIAGTVINTASNLGVKVPSIISSGVNDLGVLIKDFSIGNVVNLISNTGLIKGLDSSQLSLLTQVSGILSQKAEPVTSFNLPSYDPSKADPTLTGGFTGDSVNLPSFEPSSNLTLDSKTQQVINAVLNYGLGKFGLNAAQSKVITDLTKGNLPTNEEAILMVLQEAGFNSLSASNINDLVSLFNNVQSGNYLGAILEKDQFDSLKNVLGGFNAGGVSKVLDALGSGTELFKALNSIPDLLNLMNDYDIPTLSQIGLVFNCLDLFGKAKDVYSNVSALTSNFKSTPNYSLTPSQEANSPIFEPQYFDPAQDNLATSIALDNLPRIIQAYNSVSETSRVVTSNPDIITTNTNTSSSTPSAGTTSRVNPLVNIISQAVASENPNVTSEAATNIISNALSVASSITLDPCFRLPKLNLNDASITVSQIEDKYLYFSVPNLEALYQDLSLLPSLNDLVRIRVSGFISEDGEFFKLMISLPLQTIITRSLSLILN